MQLERNFVNFGPVTGWGLLLAILTSFGALVAVPCAAETARLGEESFYRIETIPIPPEVVLEVGGLARMNDGGLMVCTRRGEIWMHRAGAWTRWASGLDEPMGICVTGSNQVVVAQRPELTRITDTDSDGEADRFDTITDAWNYSGHVYEWTFGPARDLEGNLWGTLACWFFPTQHYSRSPYSGWEIPPPAGYSPAADTAWRGWSFKITPQGEFIPWSAGLRSPNGLGISPEGELFVSDNQGEYYGACVLHHIRRDAFHGHPNGLFWGPRAVSDPFAIPIPELERQASLPAVVFPYGEMGQSASEPVWDTTAGRFGPFAGQLFIGDQTKSTVMRVSLERIHNEYQGACYPFRSGFQCGNNRLLFDSDGSLLAGQTDRGWGAIGGKRQGLQRVVWTGNTPFEIREMRLTRSGFELEFTKPVDATSAAEPGCFSFQQFHYHYHRQYGSPQVDKTPVPITQARLSRDRTKVTLDLRELIPRRIYELRLRDVVSGDGAALAHDVAYYTLNQLVPNPRAH